MPREVTDADGISWSCIQAFAGLGNDPGKAAAARVDGMPDHVYVVCTPNGSARSVRIGLPSDWEEVCPDAEIRAAIRAGLD
jgi:hypothetical protein